MYEQVVKVIRQGRIAAGHERLNRIRQVNTVDGVNMRHRARFRGNRLNRSLDMAIFSIV